MKKIIEIRTGGQNCRIIFSRWNEFLEKISIDREIAIITDSNLYDIYKNILEKWKVIIFEAGESSKNFWTVEKIVSKLLEENFTKDSFIVGFGGGVATDITAFAASIYKRGVNFGLIPTSLIAQADAAIGGKCAVNVGTIKNAVGLINQPEWILEDIYLLETLPVSEFQSGLAEIIKCAIIADKKLFDHLESAPDISLKELDKVENIVLKSAQIKAGIVSKDLFEISERKLLNAGHTFGHFYEAAYGLKHGYAVALGIIKEAEFAFSSLGLKREIYDRIKSALFSFGFSNFPKKTSSCAKYVVNDKKAGFGKISLPVPFEIGKASLCEVDINSLISFLDKN